MLFNRLPKAVLWDMDGTLIDSEPHWLRSERELAEQHNVAWTDEDGKELVGMSLSDSSRIIKEKISSDMSQEEITAHLTASVSAGLEREIIWRPGAKELLLQLRRRGIKTALVTMSLRSMATQVVDAMGFKAFDVIVAGDDVIHGKPHAEPYLKAAQLLGVAPSDCVAFEDSISGILSAEAAGTKAVGIPNIMMIPAREDRILWETLEGKTIKDLRNLFND
jgi:HAD superfamily hydrolase (TIGR01509 family)